jgi:HlyD family secretion protein
MPIRPSGAPMEVPPGLPPSGASMDRALPSLPRWRLQAPWAAAGVGLLGLSVAAVALRPASLETVASPQLATVRAGEFRDELVLRARAEPLRSVQLDAAEAGRVEAIFAHDGETVAAGAPLYRLQSPEQEQLLMQRGAEVAQQMANVSVQRSAQAASLAANRRELAQLQASAQQAETEHARQAQLAAAGFVSSAALEQAERQRALAAQLLREARQDQTLEAETRRQSIDEMSRAVAGLQRGLQLLERSRERLLQRAPIAGLLSGFGLQVGASVRPGDRLGHIDDPASGMQLVAEVDEYHLPRLQVGQEAVVGSDALKTSSTSPATATAATTPAVSGPSATLHLAQTLPQVQAGKVRALLRWAEGSPPPSGLRAGQSVELRLQLSPATPALILPEGPGVQSPLYVRQGRELQRRSVQLGRRAAGQVEVLSGLQAGDQVLISLPPSAAERLALP